MGETVSLDVELKRPVERVWHALTDAATLSRWTYFETNDFQPVVGHKFQFRGKPSVGWTGTIDCEVLEVDKPHRLSYTWVGGPQTMLVRTKVTWTLTESENGGTRLHLEQSGFESQAKQAIAGAKYGWTGMLGQLQTLLAAG
jgi:uncharacterized protein YndB with AHSA1/START domain